MGRGRRGGGRRVGGEESGAGAGLAQADAVDVAVDALQVLLLHPPAQLGPRNGHALGL